MVFVGVHVVPMHTALILANQTVIVRDGRVESIGAAAQTSVPPNASVIDGRGRYLMPALIDMHAHVLEADLPAYVANGIGTIRNMWGTPSVARLTREIAAGTRRGPTLISASPGLDGVPPQWPLTQIVTVPDSAADLVRAQVAAGWPFLKVYTRLSAAVFDAVMQSAREQGIAPIGHVPLAVDVRHALTSGMRSIEHLTGYDRAVSRTSSGGTFGWVDADRSRYAELATATAAASVWNCPTLAIFVALSRQHSQGDRERLIANRRAFVLELARRGGGRLLVGTDAGIDIVAPGTSIHDELAEFVAAGLTPF